VKANKILKRIAKIEALMSKVADRSSASAPHIREPLREAQAAVTRAEDVRFSVNFRAGSPDHYALLSGPTGRFRCAPFGIQQGDEAWQRTISNNAPELLLGHQ